MNAHSEFYGNPLPKRFTPEEAVHQLGYDGIEELEEWDRREASQFPHNLPKAFANILWLFGAWGAAAKGFWQSFKQP
jgi:hypothetical protein